MIARHNRPARDQGLESEARCNAAQCPSSDTLRNHKCSDGNDPIFHSSSIDVTARRYDDLSAKVNVPFPRIYPSTEQKPWPTRTNLRTIELEVDFALIEARCRLKAEGLRWAVERRRLMAGGYCFRS